MHFIMYTDGYKYQLEAPYITKTAITPDNKIRAEFIDLDTDGLLIIHPGFAWDGPSGPTLDTPNFMRGSLVHDCLYLLMRDGLLDHTKWRPKADELLRDICLEDGMSKLRAWFVYKSVSWFGDPFSDPKNKRPVLRAPE